MAQGRRPSSNSNDNTCSPFYGCLVAPLTALRSGFFISMAASTSWWLMCCFTPFHTNKVPLSTLAYLLGCDNRSGLCFHRDTRWRSAVVDGGAGGPLAVDWCCSSCSQRRLARVAFALLIRGTPQTATFNKKSNISKLKFWPTQERMRARLLAPWCRFTRHRQTEDETAHGPFGTGNHTGIL